jgi:cytochrome c556
MTSTTTILSLVIAAVGACTSPARHEVATAEPVEVSAQVTERPRQLPKQQTATTHTFMREHASEALDMRSAVIAGRFDQLHRSAAIMASDAWSPHLRPEYLPQVTAVRASASAALDARSMAEAGAALGHLGEACASCHRDKGGPPQLTAIETLPRGVGSMAAHVAAERALWEGLFTPSSASWKRGAETLAAAPELASDVEDVAQLAQQVRDLARQAAAGAPRGDVYGNIMATCATCHRRLDVQPR